MKRVVISCGPIPARLDSVKFITNRFRGGLAFETAKRLAQEKDFELTIVKWTHTPLPWSIEEARAMGIHDLVDVIDVVEYAEWFKAHANDYDAFVMAAAVANLMPSEPYETKFPSHLYNVGDKFDIKFEIAPRAIDIIKKINPRCCLIGYKLFDAKSDEELVEIAKHTLSDSKANVIFANTPSDAKSRKIAVMADGAAILMDFDEHIKFMKNAIYAEYFRTQDTGKWPIWQYTSENPALKEAFYIVKRFEQTFPHFGTVAVRVPGIGMMTTSRGHRGEPVVVTGVDFKNHIVMCPNGQKATLNAPLLWKMLEENPAADYIVHRHFDDPMAAVYEKCFHFDAGYEFPGTVGEAELYNGHHAAVRIQNHGYLVPCMKNEVDWGKYYTMFPRKYFGTRAAIEEVLHHAETHPELESLEVGGNTACRCKYNLDPNMQAPNVLSYDDLDGRKFDIIVARNSINYLSEEEIVKVMATLKEGGTFIANGFANAPEVKISQDDDNHQELALQRYDKEKGALMIDHYLFIGDEIYAHSFYARGEADYLRLGFEVERDGNSIIIRKNG